MFNMASPKAPPVDRPRKGPAWRRRALTAPRIIFRVVVSTCALVPRRYDALLAGILSWAVTGGRRLA